jgi:hypothetical protein
VPSADEVPHAVIVPSAFNINCSCHRRP